MTAPAFEGYEVTAGIGRDVLEARIKELVAFAREVDALITACGEVNQANAMRVIRRLELRLECFPGCTRALGHQGSCWV